MPIARPMGLRRALEAGLIVAALQAFAPAQAKTIYCCEVAGQTQCSDVLPAACYGQAYREIGPQGTVRKKVPAPPTAAEIARRKADEERAREDEARAAKTRRLDQALLETYTSVADLDRRRERALADADRDIAELRARDDSILERRRQILPDARPDPAARPPAERKITRAQAEALRDIDSELAAHRSVLESKLRERESVRQRYDEDRERYLELTAPAKRTPR